MDAIVNIPIDEAHFPDENFRDFVRKNCSSDGKVLTSKDIARVTEIDCSCVSSRISKVKKPIKDLTGIEFFDELEYLDCTYNDLSTLDISKNSELRYLYCGYNNLETLDISQNAELIELNCEHNHIATLVMGYFQDLQLDLDLCHIDCNEVIKVYGESGDVRDLLENVDKPKGRKR